MDPTALLGMEGIMLASFVRRQMSTFRWLILSILLVTSLGCYRYVPSTIEAVQTGAHVRAVLSTDAQEDLQSRAGIDLSTLEGKVVEENGDQVVLSVPTVKLASPYGAQSLHQMIDVPRRGIVRVDVRKLDKLRTYGLIGIGAGVAAFITAQAFGEGDPASPDGTNGDPPEHIQGILFWVPVIRW
jgi:hypothetical protein